MADTIIGIEGKCADCGREGHGISHWGPLSPPAKHRPHYCGACWFFREQHYEATKEAAPLGTDWLLRAANAEKERLEKARQQREQEGYRQQELNEELLLVKRHTLRIEEELTELQRHLAALAGAVTKVPPVVPK